MKGYVQEIEEQTAENTGSRRVLYTIYGPPNHRDGVVRATKAEAEASEEHFDGKTTERLEVRPTAPALH